MKVYGGTNVQIRVFLTLESGWLDPAAALLPYKEPPEPIR
jgi:hypothetical protein